MGIMDKFLNIMRLNPDDDDDFYNEDYDYDDDYEDEDIKPKSSFRKEKRMDDYDDDYDTGKSYQDRKSVV